MDEELEQRKISPSSFFEQLTAVRETADAAQKTSNSNLNLLNSLKTEIQVLSTEFKLFKDEKADEDFAEQDRKQKELMDQRAKAQGEKKGEGTSAEKESDEQKGGGGGIGGFIKNFFGGLIGGTLGIALQGIAGLVDFGAKSVLKAKEIGGGIADALTFNMFDFDGKGKPDKKNLSSIMGGDKDYEKNRKKNLDLKDEVKKELKDDLGIGDKEKAYKKNRRGGKGKDLKEEIKEELKQEFNLGDSLKETGKNILGGIKKTFGGIKDTISNFDGRPGSRDTKYEGVKSDNEKYGDTMPDGAFGIGSKSTDSFSSEKEAKSINTYDKEVIKKEESFSMPKGKKTSFSDALSGNRNIIHQFLFEERLKSIPPGKAFNDFSGNPAYDSDVDTFLRGLKDSPQGYGIEINAGRVYLSKEKSKDGGYTFGRDTKYEGVKSDNEMYGDTFPKRSFTGSKKNTYARTMLEFDEGGFVSGPGGKDKVNAKLTSGEFVMSKDATQKIGVSNLMAMNEDGSETNKKIPSVTELGGLGGGGGGTNAITSKAKSKTMGNYLKDALKISTIPARFLLNIKSKPDPTEKFADFYNTPEEKVDEALRKFNTNKNISTKLESDDFEINAITNLSQSVENLGQGVNMLRAQNQVLNPSNQNPSPLAPAQPPQVSQAELKSTFAPIAAINILKMNSEKYLSISGDSSMVAS